MVSVFTGYFARSVCFHFQIVHYLFLLFFHSLRRLSIVFPFVQCETAETNFDRMWHIKGIFANFVRCSLSRDIHVMAQPSLWLIGGWLIGSKVQKSCSKRNRKYWNVPLIFFHWKGHLLGTRQMANRWNNSLPCQLNASVCDSKMISGACKNARVS